MWRSYHGVAPSIATSTPRDTVRIMNPKDAPASDLVNRPSAADTSPCSTRWWPWARPVLALAAVLGFGAWCVGLPAQAASLATSSASLAVDSLSTSVGVFSGAVSGLASSSSPGRGKVAQGAYRIRWVQALNGVPARVLLDLHPIEPHEAEGAQPWQLRLPAEVVAASALEAGAVVAVRERPYGFGLWQLGAAQPFYLVVQDQWAQALQRRTVGGDPATPSSR